ncbi:hypothetical protein AA313_de0203232 [Arthrobotrys entomopaga]|nr:hypothetical protein AA313_de0203232 [Arthrobotrys entomopaga]
MSYRDGGGYGHGGYHSDLPPAQLGDINIDPDEFPNVAQHLAGLHIGGSSTGGSTGYPEEGARHIFVGSNGHYYTNEVPTSTATYSGYGYIAAPEPSASTPPHPFAGALRSPVETSQSFSGMGYTYGYSVGPLSPSVNAPQPQPQQLFNSTAPGTPTIQYYPQSFPYNMSPAPSSAHSAFPPPNQLSLPPSSPSIASTPSLPRPESLFQNRRFSYDDGTAANLHSRIRLSYDQYMQDYEARERYDSFATHDEPTRGRRLAPNYYKPSGEYMVPGASVPRNSAKTPGHGGDAGTRRPPLGIAAVHQSRPPNSRHSSSESGDAEPPYHSGPYDEYNNPGRPKTSKSRPHSFSYPDRYYKLNIEPDDHDPRSSSGSLGGSSLRLGSTTMVTQPDRYHRDGYPDRGAIIHPSNSRVGRSYHPRNPQDNPEGTITYIATDESADERRRRHRSKSRYRTQTPGPEASERQFPSEDPPRGYRIVTKSRPSSPSPPPRRAKSRRRQGSPSPDGYRSKSHLRSKSRPRPEIIQSSRPEIAQSSRPEIIQPSRPIRAESPRRGETSGSSRPKTPMPESSGSDVEQNLRLREIDRELERIQRDRNKLEKMSREREAMMETYRRQQEEEMLKQAQAAEENRGKEPERRHKSRHRASSRSTSTERTERTERDTDRESRKERHKDKDKSRRDREKDKDGEREGRRDKTRDKKEDRERDRARDSYRDGEKSRDKRAEETSQSKPESAKVTDPALANPMVENLNPRRERAGIQPGQSFIRPDLMCAMNALGLCIVEQDPSDDHAHNKLLRLDCGHGYHEDCLRSTISSKERIPMDQVDLEAEKLWCERCRNVYGKKAGR